MNRRLGQRGTQIAELAIVLPLLAFLALVVSEGSGFIRVHQVINNAAREGARLAIQQQNYGHTDDIIADVVAYAANNGITLAAGNVTIEQNVLIPRATGGNDIGSRVTVTYSYPLRFLPNLPFFHAPSSVTLVGRAEFGNLW
jgi:Flp pilus assembly protein TadG